MNHLYDFLFANIFITFLTQNKLKNKQLTENLNQDNKVHSYYNEKKAILI